MAEKRVLNNARDLAAGAPRPPGALSLELQRSMLRMRGEYMSPDGKGVDYAALTKSELFSNYLQLAGELVHCNISEQSQDERKAFFINIYNALTIHGLATAEQLPSSVLDIGQFWQTTAYNIGGLVYSLDDIEHGILRGNKPHPSATDSPFLASDPRRKFSLESCDPRVHFALVCGAKSCPAIQVYSAKNLDSTLTHAARNFCSQEVNIDPSQKKVTLSKIFVWYGSDFGDTESDVLRWVCQYLPEKEQSDLKQLLGNQEHIQVEGRSYDWLLNKL